MTTTDLLDDIHALLAKMDDRDLQVVRRYLEHRVEEAEERQAFEEERGEVWKRVFAEPMPRRGSPEACLRLIGIFTREESEKMGEIIEEMRREDKESVRRAWAEGKELP